MNGVILRKRGDRGFLFIKGDDDSNGGKSQDYFCHQSQCITPFEELHEGDFVTFRVQAHEKGLRAIEVKLQ